MSDVNNVNNVLVLLTAMPPTRGHEALIRFAAEYAYGSGANLVVMHNTQPDEPMVDERVVAVRNLFYRVAEEFGVGYGLVPGGWRYVNYNKELEQDPKVPGFWDTWRGLLEQEAGWGVAGDVVVSSDDYGREVAGLFPGCKWIPFDGARSIVPSRGTDVRVGGLRWGWDMLMPEFASAVRMRVTVFGAESCGKTTLSRALSVALGGAGGSWVPEWAREYLERVDGHLSVEAMEEIWHGQAALQSVAWDMARSWCVVQDTDLYSTVGYWDFWGGESHGLPATPKGLVSDAALSRSDLYLVVNSNIPFEVDPIRYGGDKREQSDEYWIGVCERYDLPYVVIESSGLDERVHEAVEAVRERFDESRNMLYNRRGQ